MSISLDLRGCSQPSRVGSGYGQESARQRFDSREDPFTDKLGEVNGRTKLRANPSSVVLTKLHVPHGLAIATTLEGASCGYCLCSLGPSALLGCDDHPSVR